MNENAKIFDCLLETFENNDIREFAQKCIDTIPPYFWEVGASSTGKYHPQYTLGTLGLARHTCALVRILNHILSIDCYKNDYTSRERDLLRLAGIMHDTRKSGDQSDYENNKYTKFEHPIMAAQVVRKVETTLSKEEIELIATTIESHMGQWNTDKRNSTVLPTPENKYQKILHLSDYLASRKDLEVLFDEKFTAKTEVPDINTYILNFGKYKGKTLPEIAQIDSGYISWAKENMDREPIKSLLTQM